LRSLTTSSKSFFLGLFGRTFEKCLVGSHENQKGLKMLAILFNLIITGHVHWMLLLFQWILSLYFFFLMWHLSNCFCFFRPQMHSLHKGYPASTHCQQSARRQEPTFQRSLGPLEGILALALNSFRLQSVSRTFLMTFPIYFPNICYSFYISKSIKWCLKYFKWFTMLK
jgi:hypothetical protein